MTELKGPSASFFVHYWGAKPHHLGNAPHSHSFFEICFVAEGEGFYVQEGVTYPLHPGTLYCSKPGSRHHIRSERGMLLLFVAFETVESASTPELGGIVRRLQSHPHLFVPEAQNSTPAFVWEALLRQASEAGAPYPEVTERLAYSLLLSALSLLLERSGPAGAGPDDGAAGLRGSVKDVKDYIEAHLSDKIKLDDAARSLHLSPRQLTRLLADELGQSLPALVRTERVKRAAYLLMYTDIPMKEIAGQSGFETVHYFTRVFSQVMGISPSRFRKSVAGSEAEEAVIHRYLQRVASRYQKKPRTK